MWFYKSRQEEKEQEFMERISRDLKEIRQTTETISRQVLAGKSGFENLKAAVSELGQELGGLKEMQKEQEKQISCQSDSFENLLEEIQSQREERNSFYEEKKEFHQKEHALLSLIVCCREQMGILKGQVSEEFSMEEEKRDTWLRQFQAMDQEVARLMRPCGLEETGVVGEAVDYDLHEILEIGETEDEEKAGTVAQVYGRGILQGDHIIKKAKVMAYKLNSNAEGETVEQKE